MKNTGKNSTKNILGPVFQKACHRAYLDAIRSQPSLKLRDLFSYWNEGHSDVDLIGNISVGELGSVLRLDGDEAIDEVYGKRLQDLQPKKIDAYDSQILNVLKSIKGRYATSAYVRDRFNGTHSMFQKRVRKLRDLGLVEKSGTTRNACYRISNHQTSLDLSA